MYELEERSEKVTIAGEEHNFVLTTKATKEISKRYGGLEKLGEKLMKSESFELAIDEMIFLVTLLANQGILINNLIHKDKQRECLTEEKVELLTSPIELTNFKESIMSAMLKGTKRNIESEEDETKNV